MGLWDCQRIEKSTMRKVHARLAGSMFERIGMGCCESKKDMYSLRNCHFYLHYIYIDAERFSSYIDHAYMYIIIHDYILHAVSSPDYPFQQTQMKTCLNNRSRFKHQPGILVAIGNEQQATGGWGVLQRLGMMLRMVVFPGLASALPPTKNEFAIYIYICIYI